MGNAASHHRCYLYWGAVLVSMIWAPDGVQGWNIPYLGGEIGPPASAANGPADDPGVRVDDTPISTDDGAEDRPHFAPVPAGAPAAVDNIPLLSTVAAPLIGPVDAPHLRSLPTYFSNQIPDRIKRLWPTILSASHAARLRIYHFLWYKPPVGLVGAWSFLRVSEKLYGVFRPPPPASGEEALADAEGKLMGSVKALMMPSKASFKLSPWWSIGMRYSANLQSQQVQKRRRMRRRKVRKGRSFDLDRGDRSYDNFGGIETVRVRAYQEGLRSALAVKSTEIKSSPSRGNGGTNPSKGTSLFGTERNKDDAENGINGGEPMADYTKDLETAFGALRLSCPPKGSREYFVEQSAEALSALGKYITPSNKYVKQGTDEEPAASIHEQNIQLLLHHSSKLIELRTLDALLRTLRDRHLIVSTRLRRTSDYWKWHVNLSGGRLGHLVQAVRQRVMTVLPWMGDDFRDRNQKEYELATATWEREVEWLGKVEHLLLERPGEMEVGDLLSVVGDSKQKQTSWLNSIANVRERNTMNSKPSMTASIQFFLQSKNRIWVKKTEEWSKAAREVIKDSLDETISSSFTSVNESDGIDESIEDMDEAKKTSNVYAESQFLESWASYDDNTSGAYSWLTVLSLVDYAALPRRAGERRHNQLSGLTDQIKRFDLLGIPSSVIVLAAANSLHDNVIALHKQEIVDFFKGITTALWGILEFRFYNPMKDIILDLLNRRPHMVDPFALMNEQTSLDNMLKDLGVGDGTRGTRAIALAAVSRMYEQEVAGGAIRGIVRGRVAQLMLIQIQQLKADLLQAMDTIDNLVDANRLNVQLVASIPAVLILFFGTRALYLFWSNIRMKDFRLPRDVHAEMSDYLKKVEECLVLSNYQLVAPGPNMEPHIARAEACLRPKEMGQLLLLLHTYLNLLDYMSPPFPSKQCDSIHHSVQNLLMQGQMSSSRQLELLKVIQSKHADLLKSL